jgi:hypothetical protein
MARSSNKARPVAKPGDEELATWLRTELTARRQKRGGDTSPLAPAELPVAKKPSWLRFEGFGGGLAFVHGAGPMMEAVGKTLDWAQEILIQALLGNVPWSVVGAFLKFVLLPSGRRVEDYVTDAEFEELRASLHSLRAKPKSARKTAKKKAAAKKAARKTVAKKAVAKKTAAARAKPSARKATPRKPAAPKPAAAKRPTRPREPGRRRAATER